MENTEIVIYELRLALYDMIRVTKALTEDRGTLLNARKRVEAAEVILNKHFKITDVLRDAQGKKKEASTGPVWVKVTDRLPPNDMYMDYPKKHCLKLKSDGSEAQYGQGNYEDIQYLLKTSGHDNVYWLDESAITPNQPSTGPCQGDNGKCVCPESCEQNGNCKWPVGEKEASNG